ncbi:DUF4404 family protein [Psychromonas sp. CD1]|uniref:DUF4404 family protein n=1 Tax=Psychromonas sp. CD1 TaxID=1979839 RepID=UPI000B9A8470|nr:DUF4404 family protein [Psychromonas sp. CD1]
MSIQKIKSEFDKLSEILNNDLIADECTAGALKEVHDQLQEAILSGDPAQYLRNRKIMQQLLLFEETNPVVTKVIKDILNTLSGMGI